MQPKTAKFTIELTPEGVSGSMNLCNISPQEAVGILVQGSEALSKQILEKAELQLKSSNEKGNN